MQGLWIGAEKGEPISVLQTTSGTESLQALVATQQWGATRDLQVLINGSVFLTDSHGNTEDGQLQAMNGSSDRCTGILWTTTKETWCSAKACSMPPLPAIQQTCFFSQDWRYKQVPTAPWEYTESESEYPDISSESQT